MVLNLLTKVFGSQNERELKRLQPIVDQINALEPAMQALSDKELKAQTAVFKQRIEQGETLDDILPEAFATVREASMRTLKMRHFDVQLIGGIVLHQGKISEIHGKSVILASGGFESNSDWRTRYLGPGWDLVKVRGTRHNMGEGIKMALDIGAMPYGNWSGCHAVGWDLNAPEFGDLAVGDNFQKHSYPLGIMVNATGKRFVDEGADFRNYTYAKYGKVILTQPPGVGAGSMARPTLVGLAVDRMAG